MINGAFGASDGFADIPPPRPQAVLDAFSSLEIYFLTMLVGTKCHKETRSPCTAEKETLILETAPRLGLPGWDSQSSEFDQPVSRVIEWSLHFEVPVPAHRDNESFAQSNEKEELC